MKSVDISESLGKLPPQNIEMEEAVLGALLLEKHVLKTVVQFLKVEHFCMEVHKVIYSAIMDLYVLSEPIDMRTVVNQLRKNGQLELVGGRYYVAELTSKVNSTANIQSHARVIIEMAMKRELIHIASKIHQEAYEDTSDSLDLLESSKKAIEDLRKWTKDNKTSYYPVNKKSLQKKLMDERPKGETSRIAAMDEIFKWKRGNISGWYGWSNDGKSSCFDYFAVVKAKIDGWKFCMMKQEDMSNSITEDGVEKDADDIHNGLVWTYTGKVVDADTAKRYFLPKITSEEHDKASDWVNEHFFIVDPVDRRPDSVLELFQEMHDKYKIDVFLVDPFKSLDMPETSRTDWMMDKFFIKCKEFAIQTNSNFNFIAHPKSLQDVKISKDPNSAFKIVTQFMIAGGAAWDNNMDSQYSIYRPERHLNMSDPKVHFWNLKQRKAEIIGARRGVYELIKFDWKTRRYLFNGLDPISGIAFDEKGKPIETLIDFTEAKVTLGDLPF